MALAITCDCGARFEVDDSLAGQTVACPECQHQHPAPAAPTAPPATSLLALGSVVLALVGAFTVVGTLAAVGLGVAALLRIRRAEGRLAGAGFATFGIVAGLVLTALTLFAFTSNELFGFGSWVRERTLAAQLDTSGPLEVKTPAFTITRPSERWGQVQGARSDDPAVFAIQEDLDLVLLNVQRYAYVDVNLFEGMGVTGVEGTIEELGVVGNPFGDDDDPNGRARSKRAPVTVVQRRELPEVDGLTGLELVLDTRRGGQTWRFVVRLLHRPEAKWNGPVWVVRGYTPARKFPLNEQELRRAVESFRPVGR